MDKAPIKKQSIFTKPTANITYTNIFNIPSLNPSTSDIMIT